MAPGGAETSVFHNTVVPESAQVDFSFDTVGVSLRLGWRDVGDILAAKLPQIPRSTEREELFKVTLQ